MAKGNVGPDLPLTMTDQDGTSWQADFIVGKHGMTLSKRENWADIQNRKVSMYTVALEDLERIVVRVAERHA
jgi:hypothetical protein